VLFDGEGFLWNPFDWDEDIAAELAGQMGIPAMNDQQWMVVRFLREYYGENGRSPLNRPLAKGVGMPLLELEQLFPEGIKYGARRIAGLPNPKNCV
jgi:tRNA 2-thiouridine synthesizing protein E